MGNSVRKSAYVDSLREGQAADVVDDEDNHLKAFLRRFYVDEKKEKIKLG